MDDLVQPGRKKKEWLDRRLGIGLETRNEDLQKLQQQGQGNIPGFIVKGVVLVLAVALLPLLQKQSNVSSYANQMTVARSWELFSLVVVGLAVCLVTRRANKDKDINDDGQGTQHYVQKMFEFAGVFDDFKADGVRDKVETWSSRCQPEEPLIVIAGDLKKKEIGEKPILLPVRSLKSTLSNPDVLDFLNDGKVADSKLVQESKNEVRNGELLTVESGNFEEEVDHFMSANGEPAVFPSPIPWASRRDVLSGGKEPHQPALAAENSAPIDGKTEHANEFPAIPSPIPWHTRPDRTSNDGKKKNTSENPNVCEGKPPLVPPQRPPPPPPPPSSFRSPSPRPSPSPPPPPTPSVSPFRSPSPGPSPRSEGLANGGYHKNVETPPRTPPQKLSSPRPSPSPPRPRNAPVQNGSSQKQTNPTVASAKETPPPPTPAVTENGLRAKNGSSQNSHANGDVSRRRDSKDVPSSASSDEVKPSKAPIPSPPPSTAPVSPPPSAVFEESPAPRKASENGGPYRSDSSSQGREGSSHRSDSRSKSRDASSQRSDSRSKSRDASSHSQHSSREVEIDSSVLKQKIKDTDIPPRTQSEKSSPKVPSPPPPPVYADAPLPAPLPPPPPPPLYPDKSVPDPITRQPSVPKDEDHTACFSDDLKHESRASSPPKVVFEIGKCDSESEPELELENSEDHFEASVDEVDKKAEKFIAKFHEQIRLQRLESIRRTQ